MPRKKGRAKGQPAGAEKKDNKYKGAHRKPLANSLNTTYTLAEEARNTSHHGTEFWGISTKLRNKPVAFHSTGFVEPSKWTEKEAAGIESSDDESDNQTKPKEQDSEESGSSEAKQVEEAPLFFFDTEKTGTTKVNVPLPAGPLVVERASEPEDSSSDDDVILFKGRNNRNASTENTSIRNTPVELSAQATEVDEEDSDVDEQNQGMLVTKPRTRGRRGGIRTAKYRNTQQEDDDMLSDYIKNMEENGELQELKDYIGQMVVTDNVPSDMSSDDENIQRKAGDDVSSDTEAEHTPSDDSDVEISEPDSDGNNDLRALIKAKFLDPNESAFDHMDWEVPMPNRRRKKNAKDKLLTGLDDIDSDMERQIQSAWKNDRMKKANRKKQRQELRELGLLGKNANPDDVRLKYPNGMNIDQVLDELRVFLTSQADMLSLPPMDKHSRKLIHQLANKFNVKSKSMGNGEQRRPALYRTKRTLAFSERIFNQAASRISRQHFPRLDNGPGFLKGAKPSSFAETSYRDGDIVGASAPELGTDNRGRAMLEKLGWSRGTALGTEENQGILQPVLQTMKRSKAGLG